MFNQRLYSFTDAPLLSQNTSMNAIMYDSGFEDSTMPYPLFDRRACSIFAPIFNRKTASRGRRKIHDDSWASPTIESEETEADEKQSLQSLS